MSEKTLNLGTTPERDKAMVRKLREHPCFGGCGKTWAEAEGGWVGFCKVDGKTELAPAWHCSECSEKRAEQDGGLKADDGDQELCSLMPSWGIKPRFTLVPSEEGVRWVDLENASEEDLRALREFLQMNPSE